jgi:FtsH-binding integral membrane protein
MDTLCNFFDTKKNRSHTCAYYDWEFLVIAGSLTLGMFVGLTAYAFYTKEDFTIKYGLLWTTSWSLFAAIIIGAIVQD